MTQETHETYPDGGTPITDPEAQPASDPVRVPNVHAHAVSGLAHEPLGDAPVATVEETEDSTGTKDGTVDDVPATVPISVEVPAGSIEERVAWVAQAEGQDRHDRADAVYDHEVAAGADGASLEALAADLRTAVYGPAQDIPVQPQDAPVQPEATPAADSDSSGTDDGTIPDAADQPTEGTDDGTVEGNALAGVEDASPGTVEQSPADPEPGTKVGELEYVEGGTLLPPVSDAGAEATTTGPVTVPEGLTGEALDAWVSGDAEEGDAETNPARHQAYLDRRSAAGLGPSEPPPA